jgi:diamine N-acetyltransferase
VIGMADVELREINEDNRADIVGLAVSPEQTYYVEGVVASLDEALEHPDAKPWYRAIYDGDVPVGFIMISDGITVDNPDYIGPYYLWRLLIDQHHQGQGYGSAALDLVVQRLRTKKDALVLLTSYVDGPASPKSFYLRYGFRETGRVQAGEPILELDLRPTP